MKNTKVLFSLALVAVFALSFVFVACNRSAKEVNPTTDKTSSQSPRTKNAPIQQILEVGTYSGTTVSMTLSFAVVEQAFKEAFEEQGVTATLTSAIISDTPSESESVAYMQIKGLLSNGENMTIGYELDRVNGKYNVSSSPKWWKCVAPDGCGGCKPVRTGFLGLGGVIACVCPSGGYCNFSRGSGSGSGGDGKKVIGFVEAVIKIISIL